MPDYLSCSCGEENFFPIMKLYIGENKKRLGMFYTNGLQCVKCKKIIPDKEVFQKITMKEMYQITQSKLFVYEMAVSELLVMNLPNKKNKKNSNIPFNSILQMTGGRL